jgi:hypothetical protein
MKTQMQEIDSVHMDGLVGGNPFLIPIVTGLSVGISLSFTNSIVNNWNNFKAGLFGEPDPTINQAQ